MYNDVKVESERGVVLVLLSWSELMGAGGAAVEHRERYFRPKLVRERFHLCLKVCEGWRILLSFGQRADLAVFITMLQVRTPDTDG